MNACSTENKIKYKANWIEITIKDEIKLRHKQCHNDLLKNTFIILL